MGVVVAFALTAPVAQATQVSNVVARHSSGQTFVSWTSPPGTDWIYRVYASVSPLRSAADLFNVKMVAATLDSSWYDRRFSVLTGATTSYRIDSLAAPLGADRDCAF